MSTFFAMGDHGAYVWPAYGLSVGVLLLVTALRVRRLYQASKRSTGPAHDDARSS